MTNRTGEGLVESNNLLNANDFSNLRYSIKRNIKEWYSYLATSLRFLATKEIENSYFKNNGLAETRFEDETELVVENGVIENLGTAVLTPVEYSIKLASDFSNAVNLIRSIQDVNNDNTLGGFVRAYDNKGRVIKGYLKKFSYEPSTEILTATLEERYESDFLTISKEFDNIIVNEVGYEINTLESQWYEINGDYLTLFDSNGAPIINPTLFSKVQINGTIITSIIQLSEKLIELQ